MEEREEQPSKAELPILVTLSGIVIVFKYLQSLKALGLIVSNPLGRFIVLNNPYCKQKSVIVLGKDILYITNKPYPYGFWSIKSNFVIGPSQVIVQYPTF
jgi:hypothetical protein